MVNLLKMYLTSPYRIWVRDCTFPDPQGSEIVHKFIKKISHFFADDENFSTSGEKN